MFFKFLRPKRTFLSVITELVTGLRDGSIVLDKDIEVPKLKKTDKQWNRFKEKHKPPQSWYDEDWD